VEFQNSGSLSIRASRISHNLNRHFKGSKGDSPIADSCNNISLGAFAASELDVVFSDPDDDDRDGHRNVGILRTPNATDSQRRLHQMALVTFVPL
jgi:hypothetical protein